MDQRYHYLNDDNLTGEFIKALYENARGYIKITSIGNRKGVKIYAGNMSSYKNRIPAINNKALNDGNRKISLCSSTAADIFSENTIRDIQAIVVSARVLYDHWDEKKLNKFWEETQTRLQEKNMEYLTPTYIVSAEKAYFVYILEKNIFLGQTTKAKKKRMLDFLKHIQEGLCKEWNYALGEDGFSPVPFTATINIPNSPFVEFKGDYSPYKSDPVQIRQRGIVKILKPEKGRKWDLNVLADTCMDRFRSYRKGSKRHIKIHVKEREFCTIDAMLSRRLELIKKVRHDWATLKCKRPYSWKDITKMLFMYYNFALQKTKDPVKANAMAYEVFYGTFVGMGNTYEKQMKKWRNATSLKEDKLETGYKFTDEKMFEVLKITREEAAEYGYITSSKKEYDKAYRKISYEMKRKEKEENGELPEQKRMALARKIGKYLKEDYSLKQIAEAVGVCKTTVWNYIHKYFPQHYYEINLVSPT